MWSTLKNIVDDEAKTIDHLQRRIAKKIDIKIVQQMFSGIEKQLRKIADNGSYEVCCS